MILLLTACLLRQGEAAPELKTRFWELKDGGKERAVVLIHGVRAHPIDGDKPHEAISPSWQSPDSHVTRALGDQGSVFAFSYSQNRRVEEMPQQLLPHIERLRGGGYRDVALVGFSAGALVARQFVEDHPEAGVGKVIQVCPPNAGSDWGGLARAVREGQEPFIRSLREEDRAKFVRDRAERGVRIPDRVEFVVVLGSVGGGGDGVLGKATQWPPELQEQGIPVVKVGVLHGLAMRSETAARTYARLLTETQPRWDAEAVEAARREILE
jgi:pimeloyl-ACP methyl ester carboxylesterase